MASAHNGGIKAALGEYDGVLFYTTALITICVVALGSFSPETLSNASAAARNYLTNQFGWAYLLALAFYVGFGLWVAFSKYGELTLGKEGEKPEFSTFTWIAMLFSCGIGVGYVLWGAAEPLYHYMQTPYLAEGGTKDAIPVALQISSFHWGLHTWMTYSLVGLCIAFPAFRLGKPMNIGISLYGLLGEKTENSIWSRILDLLGAVATIGGVSTALGFGIISLDYGTEHIFGITTGTSGKVLIMAVLIGMYIISASSGLKKGIAYLSTINICIAIGWGLFLLFFGETNVLMRFFTTTIGNYMTNMVKMSFWADPLIKSGWLNWWTIFYCLLIIAWAPFVGGFVARISRGRTIREYIMGAVIIPSLFSIFWFVVVGGTAINVEVSGAAPIWEAVQGNVGAGIYSILGTFPMTSFMNLVVYVNMVIFLVTSADSASFFVAMQMSKGAYEPTLLMKVIWGIFVGMLAVVLLISGGLKALQTASIVAGSPFAIAILFMVWSLFKLLKTEMAKKEAADREELKMELRKEITAEAV